jgi:hypothetical protein
MSLDQTIHTNLGRQGHQTTATIPQDQAVGLTALEDQLTRGVQVDLHPGHPTEAEDKIND